MKRVSYWCGCRWDRGIFAAIALAGALSPFATGCSPGDGTYYVAAEHDVPAHKPADFPTAVARIEGLLQRHFGVQLSEYPGEIVIPEPLDTSTEPMEVNEVWACLDELAGWLAELAIDSDLDEAKWLVARDRGAAIQAWLADHAGARDPRASIAQNAEQWQQWLVDLRHVTEAYRQLHAPATEEE